MTCLPCFVCEYGWQPGPPPAPGGRFGPHAPRSSLLHHGPISDVPCRSTGAERRLSEPSPDLHSPRDSRRSASAVYPALPDTVVTHPCLRGERVTAPKRLLSSIGPSSEARSASPRLFWPEEYRGSRTRFGPSSPHDRVERSRGSFGPSPPRPHGPFETARRMSRRARRGDVCSPHYSVFNDAHPRLVCLPIRAGTEVPLLLGRAFRSRRNARLRGTSRSSRVFSTRFLRARLQPSL
jgi:hypothetical protein